jgi:hypothetical protein
MPTRSSAFAERSGAIAAWWCRRALATFGLQATASQCGQNPLPRQLSASPRKLCADSVFAVAGLSIVRTAPIYFRRRAMPWSCRGREVRRCGSRDRFRGVRTGGSRVFLILFVLRNSWSPSYGNSRGFTRRAPSVSLATSSDWYLLTISYVRLALCSRFADTIVIAAAPWSTLGLAHQ